MANFSQWRAQADQGTVRRVTWVCGDQAVLVEEVVDTIRDLLAVSELDYVSLTAGSTPDREIWAAANQYPLVAGANRLLLIRNAEKITHWEPLFVWLTHLRQLPGVYLLFVSTDADLPYVRDDDKKVLKPHVEAMKAPKGHVVRCTAPNPVDAVAWVQRRAGLDEDLARHLLTRTGGDLASAKWVAVKLSMFDRHAGKSAINVLCDMAPMHTFVDALVMRDKPQALTALLGMGESQYGRAIGLLDSRLDLLGSLWGAARAGQSPRDVRGHPYFLVQQWMPYARHYDEQRCLYNRRLLAVVDDAFRSGARVGVLEALVALW